MKRNTIFSVISMIIGILVCLLVIISFEAVTRLRYGDKNPFKYFFNPVILTHSAIFNRSPLPLLLQERPRIFCLGGSTTHGNRAPIKGTFAYFTQLMLKKNNKNGTVYNFGVNGVSSSTTNFFIKSVISKYRPDCVVIHDGYNDLPIVIKQESKDLYSYISPDYNMPYNPYIKNNFLRYIWSFKRINFRGISKFVGTLKERIGKKDSDLYLGYDYFRYPILKGSRKDILEENKKRTKIFLEKEQDSIDYCLKNNIKVVIILEPYIKPLHAPLGTGLRDIETGFILSECHQTQQNLYLLFLLSKYKDNKNVKIVDFRELFKDKYDEFFYDECHLNPQGNFIKASQIHKALSELF